MCRTASAACQLGPGNPPSKSLSQASSDLPSYIGARRGHNTASVTLRTQSKTIVTHHRRRMWRTYDPRQPRAICNIMDPGAVRPLVHHVTPFVAPYIVESN